MLLRRGQILSVFVSRDVGDAVQEDDAGRKPLPETTVVWNWDRGRRTAIAGVLSSQCRWVQKEHTGRSAQHLAITSLLKSTLTRLQRSVTAKSLNLLVGPSRLYTRFRQARQVVSEKLHHLEMVQPSKKLRAFSPDDFLNVVATYLFEDAG